jgi:ABC-type Zn uptake system ZnuABC Zn-binding protein ZnuA
VVADLYTDTLGPEDSGAATYLEMMIYNAETIVEGLDCA